MLRVVNGFAGSAVIALLVLATIRNPKWAMRTCSFSAVEQSSADSYHGCHSGAFYVCEQALAKDEFGVPVCFRRNQFGIWTFPRLSHRIRRRPVYRPSSVDPATLHVRLRAAER
jgi:hypothetical protein